jgi:hypothetical protein
VETENVTVLRTIVTVLFVCSMAALALAALFGFESLNDALLLLSSGLLLAAVLTVFVHVSLNRSLTPFLATLPA